MLYVTSLAPGYGRAAQLQAPQPWAGEFRWARGPDVAAAGMSTWHQDATVRGWRANRNVGFSQTMPADCTGPLDVMQAYHRFGIPAAPYRPRTFGPVWTH